MNRFATRSSPSFAPQAAPSPTPGLRIEIEDAFEQPSLTVLLAHGDRQVRRLIAIALRADGHDVIEATDAGELLEAIATRIIDADRQDFDLIITGQGIPGISGLSVLASLRSRGRETPFVLLTGNATVQAHAQRLGAAVLDEPLDVESIRQAIAQTGAFERSLAAALAPRNDVAPGRGRSVG